MFNTLPRGWLASVAPNREALCLQTPKGVLLHFDAAGNHGRETLQKLAHLTDDNLFNVWPKGWAFEPVDDAAANEEVLLSVRAPDIDTCLVAFYVYPGCSRHELFNNLIDALTAPETQA